MIIDISLIYAFPFPSPSTSASNPSHPSYIGLCLLRFMFSSVDYVQIKIKLYFMWVNFFNQPFSSWIFEAAAVLC